MAYESPINILSPESRLLEFKVPPVVGFYTLPHSDVAPTGWGTPFEDDEGNPIPPPGTPGGSYPIKFVYWDLDKTSWTYTMKPGSQLYGNIDWLGPYKDPTKQDEKTRIRLSYWGPPGRHFPSTTFIYGSDPKHNDIYRNGLYLSIAPYPVLGAAIMEHPLPTNTTIFPVPPPVLGDWLIVVCRVGLNCEVYSRLIPSSTYELPGVTEEQRTQADQLYNVPQGSMSEELKTKIKALYNKDTNPYGWQYVGIIWQINENNKVGRAPNTPWFFNESGDTAQCVQDVDITFDNGVETGVQELGKEVRSFVLPNVTSLTTQAVGNLPGFTYSATSRKESEPTITVDVDSAFHYTEIPACQNEHEPGAYGFHWYDGGGETHYLSVDHVRNEVGITGNYIIGIDYYEDEEIYLYLRYDCYMSVEKWWRYGVDKSIYPDYLTYGYGPISDGVFFAEWAWWDESTGNLIQTFRKAVFDSIYPNEAAYLAAGQPTPPVGAFDGRIGAYVGLYGNVWLEWTHPVQGLQTQRLYRAGRFEAYTEEELQRDFDSSTDPAWIQYFNYLHFFDFRPKDGHLAAYFQEKYTKRVTASGTPGIHVEEIFYNLEFTEHPDLDPEEKLEPFLDVRKEDTTSINVEGDVPGQLCDMLTWNPTGAVPSPFPPFTGTFSRNDFYWDYTVTQYEAVYIEEDKFITENLEPTPHFWHENNGLDFYPWPAWRNLVSDPIKCNRAGSMTFNGDRYLFSFTYTDAEDGIAYYNYITDGNLESIVSEATRFFPALGT